MNYFVKRDEFYNQDFPLLKTKDFFFYNVPSCFDIETSSFYDGLVNGEPNKVALMYEWTFNINNKIIVGRTIEDYINAIKELHNYIYISKENLFPIYVHNLAYEFQFIKHYFRWAKVFANKKRKPIYAITEDGLWFRCSYFLSGYNLSTLGKNLTKYKAQKMVGDLDYSKIRTPITPINRKEYRYNALDTVVVVNYIKEKMEECGNIYNIPNTKTGYVRRYCRNETITKRDSKGRLTNSARNYRDIIKCLTLDMDTYKLLKDAFMGGFTHANKKYVDKHLYNVSSIDFTSSYPYVMCSSYFPMSTPINRKCTTEKELKELCDKFCCIIHIKFKNIEPKLLYDSPISKHKCKSIKGEVLNNGRVLQAEELEIVCTELDFITYDEFYEWESLEIISVHTMYRALLPKEFIFAILNLYKTKTELKGVKGKEKEYLSSKEQVNASYGMTVTDILKDSFDFLEEWEEVENMSDEMKIERYNKASNRFLYYPWGIWVTAHARRNLFTGIKEFGDDYIYSDTDSIKCLNIEKHKKYIDEYNANCINKLKDMCDLYSIPYDYIMPKSNKGIEYPLGVWDYEGTYSDFKTLGAKRYIFKKDGVWQITCAGLGKEQGMKYLKTLGSPIDFFKDNLTVPASYTGKNTHTYIDVPKSGTVTDYLGNEYKYSVKSGVHLEPAEFTLSFEKNFRLLLQSEQTRLN